MANIQQLEDGLPNGLHDARLLGLIIDYGTGEVAMRLDVVTNDGSVPTYRQGIVRLVGVQFLVIDPPASVASLVSKHPSRISTGAGHPSTAAIELPPLRVGHFLQWFFVNDWNAFIRVAAKDAEFRWNDEV